MAGRCPPRQRPADQKEWFQVTRFPALLSAGMHRTELRVKERRVPRRSAPPELFSPAPGSTLPSAPQPFLLSSTGPFVRTGFSLTRNACFSRNIHSGVDVPNLVLHSCARCLPRPFGLPAPPPFPVRPGHGWLLCFRPVAIPTAGASDLLRNLHSPFGLLPPPGSKRSVASAVLGPPRDSARFPLAPRSLMSLSSANGHGSSFQVRYVLAGLLFLKPLGTFSNMPATPFFVNNFR
jgi:hypothetical protein